MKKTIVIFTIFLFSGIIFAQNAPTAEPVYGGSVEHLDIMAVSADSSRIFLTTMSDNSMFYADIDHSGSSPFIGRFYNVPDLDSDDGFGQNIRCMVAHSASGYVIASTGKEGIISVNHRPGSRQTLVPGMAEWMAEWNDVVVYVTQGAGVDIIKAEVMSDGTFGASLSVNVIPSYSGTSRPYVTVSPDSLIYVFIGGAPPELYVSDTTINAMSVSTSFNSVAVTDLIATGHEYLAMTALPNGRLVMAGYEGTSDTPVSFAAYTDDMGANWTAFDLPGIDCGRGAPYISYGGTSSPYCLYYGRMMNQNNGDSASWTFFPTTSSGTPVMDGPISVDPNDNDLLFMKTDWGVGLSTDGATTIDEWNEGMTAVEVDDFTMSVDKSTAWVASKSGIWHVTDYLTSPVWNSTPYWPLHDSTPYRSVATTASGDTVYVGNQSGRVFRYQPSFGALNDTNFAQIFSASDFGYSYGSYIATIAIDTFSSPERIAIGIVDQQDPGESDTQGGLFIGEYDGSLWNWTSVTGGDFPITGADIYDAVFVNEAGCSVLYAGSEYHYNTTTVSARSVYKVDSLDGTYVVSQSMHNALQNISASIRTLVDGGNDTLYACGTDVGGNHPVIYKKGLADSVWISLTSHATGLPTNAEATGLTLDPSGVIYIAVNSEILTLHPGASAWTPYFSYPYGTMINFLYYDELLVGTGTGLYAHPAPGTSIGNTPDIINEFELQHVRPNPFNPTAQIFFNINREQAVSAMIYDIRGRVIDRISEKTYSRGIHSLTWEAGTFSSGIYIIRVNAGDRFECIKCTLLK